MQHKSSLKNPKHLLIHDMDDTPELIPSHQIEMDITTHTLLARASKYEWGGLCSYRISHLAA